MTKMPKEGTFSSVVSQKVSQRSCNVLKNQCFKSCSRNSKEAQFCKELSFFIDMVLESLYIHGYEITAGKCGYGSGECA